MSSSIDYNWQHLPTAGTNKSLFFQTNSEEVKAENEDIGTVKKVINTTKDDETAVTEDAVAPAVDLSYVYNAAADVVASLSEKSASHDGADVGVDEEFRKVLASPSPPVEDAAVVMTPSAEEYLQKTQDSVRTKTDAKVEDAAESKAVKQAECCIIC